MGAGYKTSAYSAMTATKRMRARSPSLWGSTRPAEYAGNVLITASGERIANAKGGMYGEDRQTDQKGKKERRDTHKAS